MDEYFMELVRRFRMSRRRLGYMRKRAVLARLMPVESNGGQGEGQVKER
jgi:hypothetical protein